MVTNYIEGREQKFIYVIAEYFYIKAFLFYFKFRISKMTFSNLLKIFRIFQILPDEKNFYLSKKENHNFYYS